MTAANISNFSAQLFTLLQNAPADKLLLQGQLSLSYGQTLNKVMSLHAYLHDQGFVAGDRIALCTKRADVLVISLLASLTYGTNITILNPELGKRSLAALAKFVEPKLVICEAQSIEELRAQDLTCLAVDTDPSRNSQSPRRLFDQLFSRFKSSKKPTLSSSEKLDFDTHVAGTKPYLHKNSSNENAIALMLFTSGTTSRPKAVQLSFANLRAQLNTFMKIYGYDADSQLLNVLPLHHTDGICNGVLATVCSQATLHRPFEFAIPRLSELMAYVYRERVTHFVAVPSMLSLIQRLGPELDDSFCSPEFAFVICSADALPEQLWRQFSERFNVRVVNCYGLTETVCMATYAGPSDEFYRLGTIGKPIDCEARIDAANGEGIGELCIRGSNVMQGYFRQPELSEEVLKDGWFHTGDLATIDAEGFIRIVGRKKTLVIVAGRNVHPENVAHELLYHPQIAEAYVFGVSDPTWGQTLACAIVAKEGQTLELSNVQKFAREQLPNVMLPSIYKFMDALPRNAAGKVLVERVRELVLQSLPPQQATDLTLDLQTSILRIASQIFQMPESELSLRSRYQETPGWDSLSHVALMCALEGNFKLTIKPRDLLAIKSLDDAFKVVERQIGKATSSVAAPMH
jgi:long-chain acyl-CoA synthetase